MLVKYTNYMVGFVLVVVLVVTGFGLALTTATAAQDGTIMIVAPEAYRELVDAWVQAFEPGDSAFAFDVQFVETEAAALESSADADIVFYSEFENPLPVEFECGVISRPYVVLPDLGARYLAGEDCGDYVSPKTPVMKAFMRFITGPEGQQIAIDQGRLSETVEVVDQAGSTVSVPQPVRGIASAYGVVTYNVYVVGGGERTLAASYVGVRGPAAQDAMRRVDPQFDAKFEAVSALNQSEFNVEEVAALAPDLILASARTQWLDTAAELGIPILRFEGETPERLKESMLLIGQVLGPDALYQAQQFNRYYDAQLELIRDQMAEVEETPRVYFSGTEPLRVASGDMYQTSMIELAGGESVSADLTGFWNDVNLEQVLAWQPDVIFVPTYGGASVEAITEADEWQIIPAVEQGQVYQLPSFISPWDTPLPDSVLGIIWMAETLYPERIDLNCEAQVQYFYSTFYDYTMSSDEAQRLCP